MLLAAALSLATQTLAAQTSAGAEVPCRIGTRMAKVELYMGAAGRAADWDRFLAEVVTPRFPDGLTVLSGQGQWRARQAITHEATRVVVIFYRPDATSDARIEAIRSSYKRRFRQRSVLRADSSACVAF